MLELAVKNGRWLLTHLPAGPRRAGPVRPLLEPPSSLARIIRRCPRRTPIA
jgi:hypothetical protein